MNVRGMTQEDISLGWGASLKSVQRWERFESEPKFFDVHDIITKVYKLTLSEVEEMALENN